jgi:short-subunit dehydrogenase
MTVEIQGARVLLTGATGGIGHAIARALHEKGANLTLTGRREDVLEPLAKEIGARSIAADLSSMAAIGGVLEDAGDIDVLIANAALPGTGQLADFTLEQIDTNLAVNLRAPIVMTQAVLPEMLARGTGHIVYIGSVSSITASPGSSMYNATKFGLRGFSNALRQDLHGTGVGVSIVMPGFVRDAGMAVEGGLIDNLPPGVRTVTPEQVAKGVLRAIRRNKGQVVVAPRELRIGATIGSVSPGLAAAAQRISGAAEVSAGHKGPKA